MITFTAGDGQAVRIPRCCAMPEPVPAALRQHVEGRALQSLYCRNCGQALLVMSWELLAGQQTRQAGGYGEQIRIVRCISGPAAVTCDRADCPVHGTARARGEYG